MPTIIEDKRFAQRRATVFHPIGAEDKTAMAAMHAIVEPNKGRLQGAAARVPFDAIMEHVAVPEGVTFVVGTVGGISGWWCRPQAAQPGAVVLHIQLGHKAQINIGRVPKDDLPVRSFFSDDRRNRPVEIVNDSAGSV